MKLNQAIYFKIDDIFTTRIDRDIWLAARTDYSVYDYKGWNAIRDATRHVVRNTLEQNLAPIVFKSHEYVFSK